MFASRIICATIADAICLPRAVFRGADAPQNFACMRTGPVRYHTQYHKTKNTPFGALFILEAWVGIEPAYKDLQSSA